MNVYNKHYTLQTKPSLSKLLAESIQS